VTASRAIAAWGGRATRPRAARTKAPDSRSLPELPRERREGLGHEDVPVARRPERAAKPAQLVGERRHRRLRRGERYEPKTGAQAPQAHPQLVQILRVAAVEQPVLVGLHLREACESNAAQRGAGGHRRVELDRPGLPRRRDAAPERESALRLARVPEAQGHVARDLAGQREEVHRISRLELDLRLADRGRVPPGPDHPAVEREFGPGAIRERERPRRTLELGHEDRAQPAADLAPREELRVRRRIERRDVQRIAGKVPLELVAGVQPSGGIAAALERLDPAPAVTP
jgi:hypothetical protein